MSDLVTVRLAQDSDKEHLIKWLMDPIVLQWFPLATEAEVEDAARIWISYSKFLCSYTACINDIPCAMAVLYLHNFKKLKHQSLFAIIVDEAHRGKGVGTKIFNVLKKEAKEKFQVELLHLEVYEGNPAMKLYRKMGFKEYGRNEAFLKEKSGVYRTKINMQMVL